MFFSAPGAKKRILFFIAGPVPTAAQQATADSLTSTRRIVMFRNAKAVSKEDGPERSDFICGVIPPQYLVETKSFKPATIIDLEQPELALSEAAPAALPMASVTAGAAAPEKPAALPVSDGVPAAVASAASESVTAAVASAPAPVAPPTDPLEGIDESEVRRFQNYNIEAIVSLVAKGDLNKLRAIELEKRGKNRTTLLKRLTDQVD